MRTILMVSRHFPPEYSVGGKRAYRLARRLPSYGVRPVVLTVPERDGGDPSAGSGLPPETLVERHFQPDFWPADKNRGSDGTASGSTRRRRKPIDIPLGRELLLTPWTVTRMVQLVRREKPSVIWATSSPYAVLLFGALASRLTGVPWIADLRDPWTTNFNQGAKPEWVKSTESVLERRLLSHASLIIFTAETAAEAYREAYPELASKIHLIRNAFDEDQAPAPPGPRRPGPLHVVHFGNCYGPRRLEHFLRAVDLLIRRGDLTTSDIVLENLGRANERDLELAAELGISEIIRTSPTIPYEQGLARLAAADVQLLIGYGSEALYIPAKLYDYLLSGAPILALTNSQEVRRIVETTSSGRWCNGDDVEGAAQALLALRRERLDGTTPARNAAEVARYSSEAMTRDFVRLLEAQHLI